MLRGQPQTELVDLIEPGRQSLERVDGVLSDLETVSGRLSEGKGTVGRVLAEDEAHAELVAALRETRLALADFRETQDEIGARLASTAGSIDSLVSDWRRGDGTLNRMVEDPSLYRNLDAASARLDRVLAAVESGDGLLSRAPRDAYLADQFTGLVVDLRALLKDLRENPGRYVQFSVF